jgi:hypothetical protein
MVHMAKRGKTNERSEMQIFMVKRGKKQSGEISVR